MPTGTPEGRCRSPEIFEYQTTWTSGLPPGLVQDFQVAQDLPDCHFPHLLWRPVEFFCEHKESSHDGRVRNFPQFVLARAQAADAIDAVDQEADKPAVHFR